MELEDEIRQVLIDKPEGMSIQALTDVLMQKGVLNDNNSNVCFFQIHARTYNMPDIFERNGSNVKLKKKSSDTNPQT